MDHNNKVRKDILDS